MQKKPSQRFRGMLVYIVAPVLLIVMAACATNPSQSTTGSTTTATASTTSTTSTTQGTSTGTQPSTSTGTAAAFQPGGISFIGPIQSIASTSFTMSAPDGQTYTLALTPQTDISAFNGVTPAVGTSVDMDATVNNDGSFTATKIKPAQPNDPDLNVIAYTGVTTSAVGTDSVLHFTVGTTSYTYTIPSTATLSDFNGNAQAIGNGVSVKVKVHFPDKTVVSVGNGGD